MNEQRARASLRDDAVTVASAYGWLAPCSPTDGRTRTCPSWKGSSPRGMAPCTPSLRHRATDLARQPDFRTVRRSDRAVGDGTRADPYDGVATADPVRCGSVRPLRLVSCRGSPRAGFSRDIPVGGVHVRSWSGRCAVGQSTLGPGSATADPAGPVVAEPAERIRGGYAQASLRSGGDRVRTNGAPRVPTGTGRAVAPRVGRSPRRRTRRTAARHRFAPAPRVAPGRRTAGPQRPPRTRCRRTRRWQRPCAHGAGGRRTPAAGRGRPGRFRRRPPWPYVVAEDRELPGALPPGVNCQTPASTARGGAARGAALSFAYRLGLDLPFLLAALGAILAERARQSARRRRCREPGAMCAADLRRVRPGPPARPNRAARGWADAGHRRGASGHRRVGPSSSFGSRCSLPAGKPPVTQRLLHCWTMP